MADAYAYNYSDKASYDLVRQAGASFTNYLAKISMSGQWSEAQKRAARDDLIRTALTGNTKGRVANESDLRRFQQAITGGSAAQGNVSSKSLIFGGTALENSGEYLRYLVQAASSDTGIGRGSALQELRRVNEIRYNQGMAQVQYEGAVFSPQSQNPAPSPTTPSIDQIIKEVNENFTNILDQNLGEISNPADNAQAPEAVKERKARVESQQRRQLFSRSISNLNALRRQSIGSMTPSSILNLSQTTLKGEDDQNG